MGATFVCQEIKGKTLQAAYNSAVQEAQIESGSGGYTGTIAESDGVRFCEEAQDFFDKNEFKGFEDFIYSTGYELSEKYGPALVVQIAKGKWLAFGTYSE